MKRYRIIKISFDTRANLLNVDIKKEWEFKVKTMHYKNKLALQQELMAIYGEASFEIKLTNFLDFGEIPLSIVAYHNKFLNQIRDSFVIGGYYPSLTSSCALGERILNYLILGLRDDYKSTPEYKNVYRKDSFDNWTTVIDTLDSWQIWNEGVKEDFTKLNKLRNESIHFKPETDYKDRELALEAIYVLKDIIKNQFSAFGNQRWFISPVNSEVYIKKEFENHPFIKLVYLSNCNLVGFKHRLEYNGKWFDVLDDNKYEDREISDEEFIKLRMGQEKG